MLSTSSGHEYIKTYFRMISRTSLGSNRKLNRLGMVLLTSMEPCGWVFLIRFCFGSDSLGRHGILYAQNRDFLSGNWVAPIVGPCSLPFL